MLFLSLSSQYFHRLTSAFVDSFTPSALPSPSLASSPSFSAACALLRLLASAFVVPVAPAGTFVLRMLHGSHSSFLLRLLTFALGNALVYPLSANLQLLCRSPTIVSALPCSPPVIVLAVRSFHQFCDIFARGPRRILPCCLLAGIGVDLVVCRWFWFVALLKHSFEPPFSRCLVFLLILGDFR